jgi:hypothetical protein
MPPFQSEIAMMLRAVLLQGERGLAADIAKALDGDGRLLDGDLEVLQVAL